jgi:penicillin-binding protein 1A
MSAKNKKKAGDKADKGGKAKRGPQSLAARVFAVLLFLIAGGLLALACLLAYYGRDLPTVTKIGDYSPPQTTHIVDRKGRLIAEAFEERRTVVAMDEIPRVLVLSVLAAEDADFYQHRGLDYAGILRALLRDALHGRPTQGASTITQQLVKNLLLTPERTLAR